ISTHIPYTTLFRSQEIKNTEINFSDTTDLLSSLLFDGTIKETRLQFQENKQYYEYTRKVDGTLYGREKELTVELVTPNSENYDNQSYFQGLSMGNQTHMLMRLAPDDRIVKDDRLYLQTQKYSKQDQATANKHRHQQIT